MSSKSGNRPSTTSTANNLQLLAILAKPGRIDKGFDCILRLSVPPESPPAPTKENFCLASFDNDRQPAPQNNSHTKEQHPQQTW
jgi:hypothetical protein